MSQTRISLLASTIRSMTYAELTSVANDLVDMQQGAKKDGWAWKPHETYGSFGMAQMLHSWAESQE